jgi:hypothetical protein
VSFFARLRRKIRSLETYKKRRDLLAVVKKSSSDLKVSLK